MHDRIIGPFLFSERTITANEYLDMQQLYAASQLEEFQQGILFDQDGALPHWGL